MAASTTATSQPLVSAPTVGDLPTDPLLNNAVTVPATNQHLRPESPRKRRRSPDVSNAAVTSHDPLKSPSPIASTPQPTGAGEMAEQKRRKVEKAKEQTQQQSKNPQVEALSALLGAQNSATSRADGASDPAATSMSAPVAAIAPEISVADQNSVGNSVTTSSVGASNAAPMDTAGVATIPAVAPEVASPGQIGEDDMREDDMQEDAPAEPENTLTVDQTPSNKAFSYPGPLHLAQMDAKRGMSLPGSGLRDSSRSPSTSNKKHKCPYCSTEFTRHHNLKSHLLTHSHEKPYLCQQCDSRFRRLHDLKRHTKLHTGERPHVCPKCQRSFARGDALARHNKGQGGCAGRRSSVGSYGGDGQGDEPMEGMVYTNEASDEPENMMDEDGGGTSVPSIRHYDPALGPIRSDTQPAHTRQPSTYPPVAAQANMGGGLRPPAPLHGGSGVPTPSGSGSSHQPFPPATSFPSSAIIASAQPMTESPKPLSPGQQQPLSAGDPRNRSPSLSSSLEQSFSRRNHQRNTPPPTLPPPAQTGGPHLPSLTSLAPPDSRYTLHSQSGGPPANSLTQPQGGSYPGANSTAAGVRTSASNSLSSHGSHPHSSGDRGNLPFGIEDRVLALVRGLEHKVERLEEEVKMLRGALQQQSAAPAVQAPVVTGSR